MNFEDAKKVTESFIQESADWISKNNLSDLPDYSELKDKEVVGSLYARDTRYYEQLTNFKSTYYGLIAFFTKFEISANREDKRSSESMVSYLQSKSKEVETKLEAARNRLTFYKTIIYMIGNVIYGAD